MTGFKIYKVLVFGAIFALSASAKNNGEKMQDLVVTYSIPINDGAIGDLNVVVDLNVFLPCNKDECAMVCGVKNKTLGYCNEVNKKLCMCTPELFYTSELEGTVVPADRENLEHKNCSVACNKRNSYARIWTRPDMTQHCICLMNQVTSTGITKCDENAITDLCKVVCQSDSAICSFNGVCLCRKNWEPFFKLSVPFVRKETPEDLKECQTFCSGYHHDHVPRIYDTKLNSREGNKTYKFREKYCLCGEWTDIGNHPETLSIINQGFQLCTGLKCKRRCGMDEAVCEPKLRRGCLCQRENIIIGDHLWSRLPTPSETKCYEACSTNNLDARVIEWNPFMTNFQAQKFQPRYRNSAFQYLYDGKFCHCIKAAIDMHQYRPCTDELCVALCGHYEAECDKRTRRACFCNTHKLPHGIGRETDPGEVNCDIGCRYGLFNARIVDIKWEVTPDSWGVASSKYCACLQTVTPGGLNHCDPLEDECPTYCGNPQAYCTHEKYCYCGIMPNLLQNNPMVRLGNGKEQDECGEKCHSWMWPLTMDMDAKNYIYDESLNSCLTESDTCPKIDTSPWKPGKAGSYSAPLDSLQLLEGKTNETFCRFCLCAKTEETMLKPGTRSLMTLEPTRGSKKVPCFLNHTCAVVGKSLHIIA